MDLYRNRTNFLQKKPQVLWHLLTSNNNKEKQKIYYNPGDRRLAYCIVIKQCLKRSYTTVFTYLDGIRLQI